MRILVAEDEESIAEIYLIALRGSGHEVIITNNGKQCVQEYEARSKLCKNDEPPFDAVILDYRMPIMDGFEAAKEIIKIRPSQRIIFASAYAKETLTDLINKVGIIAELLQKPFEIDALIDVVEDASIYNRLQELQVKIGDVRSWHPAHKQLSDLLEGILKLKDIDLDIDGLGQSRGIKSPQRESKADDLVIRIIDETLSFLGPDSLSVFYYHLAQAGVQKTSIIQEPSQFLKALDALFGSASNMVRVQILKGMEINLDLVEQSDSATKFMDSLKLTEEKEIPLMERKK